MKKLSIISVGLISTLSLANPVLADNACPQSANGASSGFSRLCSLPVGQVIGSLIALAFIIAALIALAFLVYGGIRWITSGGDKNNVEAARGQIIAAVVGLVVIFFSYVIINIVLNFFGISISNFNLPTL